VVNGPGNLIAAESGFVDAAGGDFRLLAESPAIDSGDPEFAGSTAALDGGPRVLDGNGDGIAVTDRGAYEAPVPPRGEASEPGGTSGGGGAADLVAPVVSGFSATGRRRKRTTFRFSLSEPATATIAIQRLLPGRKVGARCRKPTPRLRDRRPCRRARTKGTLTPRTLAAGLAAVRFAGRIGTKTLRPGSYRAVVVARDAAGNASRPARAAFKLVRSR